MTQRLPDSKRNELIANYMEGNTDPDYEVIPSKTQKGKYTVRKRKVSLPTNEDIPKSEPPADTPVEDKPVEEEVKEEAPPQEMPQMYYPTDYFAEYQMLLNKMMIEQMKMMRREMKHSQKKQLKMKDKSQKIYDILAEVANSKPEPEPEEEYEQDEEIEEPQEYAPPVNNTRYFENDYQNPAPVEKPPEPVPVPEPEEPQYQQEYERDIDEIGGIVRIPSRRDRLNFKNFNI